jgi:hypothetical protein
MHKQLITLAAMLTFGFASAGFAADNTAMSKDAYKAARTRSKRRTSRTRRLATA